MGKMDQKTKEEAEENGVLKLHKYHGLCMSCNNALNCAYIQNSDQQILQCEEYEGYSEPLIRTADTKAGLQPKKMSGKFKGLCMDCENNETCMFAKPEEGVWHCSEYQ